MNFPTSDYLGFQLSFHLQPEDWAGKIPTHVVALAWVETKLLLGDIEGRGWTTPSGRIEAKETPREAVMREVREEVGATLSDLEFLGWFCMEKNRDQNWSQAFAGTVRSVEPLRGDFESNEARLFELEELSSFYAGWSPLLDQFFAYAAARR